MKKTKLLKRIKKLEKAVEILAMKLNGITFSPTPSDPLGQMPKPLFLNLNEPTIGKIE